MDPRKFAGVTKKISSTPNRRTIGPTSASHSQPTPHGTSYSLSSKPKVGSVRGVTPTRRGAASGENKSNTLPPRVSKLDLTPEEELEILERLETGEFQTGVGWAQFLDPVNSKRAAATTISTTNKKGGQFKQNLAGAFASLDANSTLLAAGSNNGGGSGGGWAPEDTSSAALEDPEMPLWMKKLDELTQAVDNYREVMERTVSAVVDVQFAEFCPPNQYKRLMEKMDKTMQALKFMTDQNFSETTRLFFQNNSPQKKPSLPCPIEEQDQLLSSVTQLSENLQKFNRFLRDSECHFNLEELISTFNKLVDEMDEDMISTERQLKLVEHYSTIMRTNMDKTDVEESENDQACLQEQNYNDDDDGNMSY